MSKTLSEQLERMDRDALVAELSRTLSSLQEAERKLDERTQELFSVRSENTVIKQENTELSQEIELLKELILLRSRLPFTPSTEQMEMLFDETEILSVPLDEETEEKIAVSAHQRSRKPHDLTKLPANTPVVDIYHDQEAFSPCERCGAPTEAGEYRIVYKVATQPRKQYLECHHYATSACTSCDAEIEDGEKNLTTHWDDKKTDTLIAAPSLVADCAVRKYADGLPLYRQEAIFRREGFQISRQTLSNWLMTYIALLEPLQKRLHVHLMNSSLINQDETPVQVLNLPDSATSKSTFMFVQVGTSSEGHRVVRYSYIPDRKKDRLLSFTEGYEGYVMTDGLKGYNSLSKHLNCWVHAQRNFKKIVKVNKKAAGALKFIGIINKLFEIEKKTRKQYREREEFLSIRKEQCIKVFSELWDTMEDRRSQYAPKSPMGVAISYLYTYWESLIRYVDCYESSPDNNTAENAIRPFVLGRKNWLFSNTEAGAESSAGYYSLIETAKANGFNVYDYLWYCLTEAPKCMTVDDWDALLPWNMDVDKLSELKRVRASAKPNPNRNIPYILRGAH